MRHPPVSTGTCGIESLRKSHIRQKLVLYASQSRFCRTPHATPNPSYRMPLWQSGGAKAFALGPGSAFKNNHVRLSFLVKCDDASGQKILDIPVE